MKLLSHVQLFATPWTVAYQDPPSMGFSRQEYWRGLPFPSPVWVTREVPISCIGYTNLHSHQLCTRVLLSLHPCWYLSFLIFLTIVILTSVRLWLTFLWWLVTLNNFSYRGQFYQFFLTDFYPVFRPYFHFSLHVLFLLLLKTEHSR